ncbi:acyl-CoA dehydrogenase family protein [Minwuia thermotolerans]|uniref:Hydrolase n=1 Tax=Minwuia thermotolerans TaxID=2056226 RepID=A0A2M9FXD5_9PROT|nr:acyl-CoA dehydrogenase family protein [Minwuia thermotolerans]PJK28131.1 hydrolase [Minwuia thermotolerans]
MKMTLPEALLADVAGRGDEIEAARRLPADVARAMAKAGLFRMMIPKTLGGLELPVSESLAAMRRVAAADASAGWCVMIAATSAYKSGFLDHETAREIYGDPLGVYGGIFAPMGRAEPVDGGYRLTGRWAWASGSANCTWLSGGAVIREGDGIAKLPNGAPDSRMMIFPAAEAELIDTWMSHGLKGTGSGDMAVEDIFVPEARAVSMMTSVATHDGALYRFPTFGLLALGIAAVALGNAGAALDDLVALAASKKPTGGGRTLAERGYAQSELAQARAKLGGASAFMEDAVGRAWTLAEAGDDLDVEARADLRLAATHATRTSADVARVMYDLAGGDSVYLKSPLQRRFRDAHVMTQHMMVNPATWELTGRVAFGLPTDATFL